MSTINHQWRIARRPDGRASVTDFEWREEPVPVPGAGQVLVRNLYLSLDPTNRPWMWAQDTYLPAQSLGDVMRGLAIGRVEQSDDPAFPVGCHVSGLLGWQDYAVFGKGARVVRLPDDPSIPLTRHFGLFGHIGITAYFGVLDIGRAKTGETLLVSGAAGAVGSLAGQIGKITGCRVVGIAGTPEKCRWLVDELGFDAAIDYRREPVAERIDALCPDGIDVYFDNVGGPLLETVIGRMKLRGRLALCGAISQYNKAGVADFDPGPRNLFELVARRLRMEGFLASDYAPRAREAIESLSKWHAEGRLKYRIHVIEGLAQAPAALDKLFDGTNEGKLIVRIG